ncbi:type I polyketide synthase [Streptomyces sp. NPDC055189]
MSKVPIAIVGMDCRLPGGVTSPEGLWRLVAAGQHVAAALPEDRGWDLRRIYDPEPGVEGATYVRAGGFLDGVADFDAGLFGIGPNEAAGMDPQHRLVLESSWLALERARIAPHALRDTVTGVYVGLMDSGYYLQSRGGVPGLESHLTLGTTSSAASGRVAYTLGLRGPTLTVDTACSSSLVALHLAVQSLRTGQCERAIVSGACVMAGPTMLTQLSGLGAHSADGFCRAFSAGASGFSPAEGVVTLVLMPLAQAQASGRPVLAVIRGSAVNNDGAADAMTVPSGPAQEAVIAAALQDAGLAPAQVGAIEAHGTGTPTGDPIEARSLQAAYARFHTSDDPVWVGSLKSNIGHAQTAAGLAGVVKMVLALQNEVLPATLHAEVPTPAVDWSGSLRLLHHPRAWPRGAQPRRAGVLGYGITGTNAHVLLEEAPASPGVAPAPAPQSLSSPGVPVVWPLYGAHPEALTAQAAALADWVRTKKGADVRDVGWSLATTRSPLAHRAAVIGDDPGTLLAGLDELAAGGEPGASAVRATSRTGKGAVFVFPGQGAQWASMAARLMQTSPVFAAAMRRCAAALDPLVDFDVLQAACHLDAELAERAEVVQPVLFSVYVSLAELWKAHGVVPRAVIGHSQGEIAAAHIAGALTLADAARVVALRSRALRLVSAPGAMVSVAGPAGDVERLLAPWEGQLEVAVVNGPSATVIAGDAPAASAFLAHCAAEGIHARRLPVDYASHTRHMESVRERVLGDLAALAPRPALIPMISSTTGRTIDTTALDAQYWYGNLRRTVRFDRAIRTALAGGHRHFIEVSPHPVLTAAMADTLAEANVYAHVSATLHRDQGDLTDFATALADAHTGGLPIDWTRLYPDAHEVDLPTYQLQRTRYWLPPQPARPDLPAAGLAPAGHPLLVAAADMPDTSVALTGRVSLADHPWLAGHSLNGTTLMPATGMLDAMSWAARYAGSTGLDDIALHAPLVLTPDAAVELQVHCRASDKEGRRRVALYARHQQPPGQWICHAEAVTSAPGGSGAPGEPGAEAGPPAQAQPVDVHACYARLARRGYGFGAAFRNLTALWRHGETLYAEARLTGDQLAQAGDFGLHPALLDAALHGLVMGNEETLVRLPYAVGSFRIHANGASAARVKITPAGADSVDVTLTSFAGEPVADIEALRLMPVTGRQLRKALTPVGDLLYRLTWHPVSRAAPASTDDWATITTRDDLPGTPHAHLGALSAAIDAGSAAPAVVLLDLRTTGQRAPEDGAILGPLHQRTSDLLQVLQTFVAKENLAGARMAVVTSGAVVTRDDETVSDVIAASCAGLVRSAQSEHPDRFQLIDVPGDTLNTQALADSIATGHPQLALRETTALVPRLAHAARSAQPDAAAAAADSRRPGPPKPTTALDPHGTVLITGGTGTLAGILARHLVAEHGIRHLTLASRQGDQAPRARDLADELRARGACVTLAACDVSDRSRLRELLEDIPSEAPLSAVIHTAGILDDALLTDLTPRHLAGVLKAKAEPALHLHELTRDTDLRAFVCYSSMAGLLGLRGQGNYAAANAFLDALAQHRRAQGLSATSIAWGIWEQPTGLTGNLTDADRGRLAEQGLTPLTTRQALAAFDAMLTMNEPVLAATPPPPDTSAVLFTALTTPRTRRTAPLAAGPAEDTPGPAANRARLQGLRPNERTQELTELIRLHAARLLGHATPEALDTEQPLRAYGFDSRAFVVLRTRLADAVGLRLAATTVFDHPTCAALAQHLNTLFDEKRGPDTNSKGNADAMA